MSAAASLSNPRGPVPAGVAPGRTDYLVDVGTDIEPFFVRCAALTHRLSSPFHSVAWLRAWYATLGRTEGRRPVLVGVRSRQTGADLMLLPMVSRRSAGVSIVEFADAGVVDYQIPVLTRNWAGNADDARRLWQSVRAALCAHDVVRIDKMLGAALDESAPLPNPLMQALRTVDCEMYGNQSHAPGTWDDWRHSLGKHKRKEFERAWRVFTRSPQARFERITDAQQAQVLFERLEEQQATRRHEQGLPYVLDRPAYRAFYRQALADGLDAGRVVLTALKDGEHLVAAQLGVANGERYIALRLSHTGDEAWAGCSPGRLLLERTACHLHAQGMHWFDFGLGGYAHKAPFNVEGIALFDAVEALSWRGKPFVWAARLRRALKRQAWLVRLVRGVSGRNRHA